jgi:hypothetical protein
MCPEGPLSDPVVERSDRPPKQGNRSMPDPRGLFFVINERQHRWWLYSDEADRPLYGSVDALPLPTEPQRERSSYARRLVFRLRMIIRPADRLNRRSLWKPSRPSAGQASLPRSGQGSANT